MQHIASRESLDALTRQVLDVGRPLDDAGLATLGRELDAVSDLFLAEVPLRRTLSRSGPGSR